MSARLWTRAESYHWEITERCLISSHDTQSIQSYNRDVSQIDECSKWLTQVKCSWTKSGESAGYRSRWMVGMNFFFHLKPPPRDRVSNAISALGVKVQFMNCERRRQVGSGHLKFHYLRSLGSNRQKSFMITKNNKWRKPLISFFEGRTLRRIRNTLSAPRARKTHEEWKMTRPCQPTLVIILPPLLNLCCLWLENCGGQAASSCNLLQTKQINVGIKICASSPGFRL